MNSLLSILQLIPFIAILALILQQSHLLMTLLMLEGIMLSLVLLTPLIMMFCATSLSSMCLIILSLGACEASLGLALLVMLSRSYGSDLINNLTMNKC